MVMTNGIASSHGGGASISSHPRHAYAKSLVGETVFERLSTSKVLVVGAGGIGCELLKNLVMLGVGDIEVIDLDTIDLSNLNRQFLFTKAHISKPKSLIASATAGQFNPLVHITPYHENVKDTSRFGWEFFERFDAVCNALDNLDARRWVNRMCIMTGVPLVESGTAGFLGQVQPIMKVSRLIIRSNGNQYSYSRIENLFFRGLQNAMIAPQSLHRESTQLALSEVLPLPLFTASSGQRHGFLVSCSAQKMKVRMRSWTRHCRMVRMVSSILEQILGILPLNTLTLLSLSRGDRQSAQRG
jgi:hypothetical protein